ncbi:lysophospholipase L1-like esterase [Clostridium saccharoperbutylacetonicum]|uniref:Lipase/acylhydrolase, GDSL family n=1 Tax=Clostridium saccharoperbutylacetonicum N1-4(HMT) TaxID=931276 RepID=M1MUE2_9CLOT|nr:SGNH/GDSL hydrolase family protein [Clostridium saccharoperbutylacetonicum]AGF58281.1 lipase/acylhydrolase, GDSL family [Clostridium saccharoperbutylacetonicum N1-4(HMT)]NRT60942.1 lysophospholipase L1-like esterase [Clostridium saccharoperbutylacetonicum]NSB24255.1 lysophospholipase L1-like esterase [Clostridium saccharoperbutylacetonicum]NSB43633.1 lysophospholipase L1-like esterase [Clostridium saccharoperbutylacetonicum]
MNIAIIGGSITEGAGASTYEKSYVYKLEQYLNDKYKDIKIKNLGCGGTASHFGLFRLKRDLGDFKPDVIFVEFAVNDRIYTSVDISKYFEGLIRECAKITQKIMIIDFPTGLADSSTSIHKKIAYYYNIPIIDIQDEVWKKIGSREIKWDDIAIDNLHPNDVGHNLYIEIIKENLELINISDVRVELNEDTISNYIFKNPKINSYDNKNIEYYGHWAEESFKLNNKFDNAAITESIGDGVIFRFKGKYLSMMNLLSRDSGILQCKLDNYTFNIDLYMDSDGYFTNTINLIDLEDAEHTLTMIVSDKRNSTSTGNKIIIGGFCVDEV